MTLLPVIPLNWLPVNIPDASSQPWRGLSIKGAGESTTISIGHSENYAFPLTSNANLHVEHNLKVMGNWFSRFIASPC